MKKISKLLLIFVVSIFGIVSLTGCNKKQETQDKLTIVSTNFPGYDFARAITMDNTNVKVKMLLKPGAESHTFEPTPEDIKTIKNSDILIYVGGDSDEWVDDILNDIDTDNNSKKNLYKILQYLNEEKTMTIIMVTHDLDHNNLIGNKILSLQKGNYFYGNTNDFVKKVHH